MRPGIFIIIKIKDNHDAFLYIKKILINLLIIIIPNENSKHLQKFLKLLYLNLLI